MIARYSLSPSSPAPAARRCAALGLDRSARPIKQRDRSANARLRCSRMHHSIIRRKRLMPYQSGSMDRDRRISRAGNPRARTTMIQLAWLWLRYQPGSELAKWFRNRVGTLAGRTRRIAIVAMARKLLIALWRYVETGVVPAGAEIRAEA